MKFKLGLRFRSDNTLKTFKITKLTTKDVSFKIRDLNVGEEREYTKTVPRKGAIKFMSQNNPQLGLYLMNNYQEETNREQEE